MVKIPGAKRSYFYYTQSKIFSLLADLAAKAAETGAQDLVIWVHEYPD